MQSSSTKFDQRLLDIQYASVDDNQDGIPDSSTSAASVRIETPATSISTIPQTLRNDQSGLKSALGLVSTNDSTNLTLPTVIPAGSTLPMSIQSGSQPQQLQVIQQSVPFQPQFFPGFQQSSFRNHQPMALTSQQLASLGAQQINPHLIHLIQDPRFQTNTNERILGNQPIQLVSSPIGVPALFNGRII